MKIASAAGYFPSWSNCRTSASLATSRSGMAAPQAGRGTIVFECGWTDGKSAPKSPIDAAMRQPNTDFFQEPIRMWIGCLRCLRLVEGHVSRKVGARALGATTVTAFIFRV